MNLECNNICVRDFLITDIENKIKWINNPLNNEFLHYDIPLEVGKTKAWFYKKDNSKRADCVIEYSGIPVGLIGLINIDIINNKAEFYISMGEPSFKRKGIATKATYMILEYAFNVLNLNKIYLHVDEKNESACALYEKTGFICEGVFVQDMMHRGEFINRKRYAMLKENFAVKV